MFHIVTGVQALNDRFLGTSKVFVTSVWIESHLALLVLARVVQSFRVSSWPSLSSRLLWGDDALKVT